MALVRPWCGRARGRRRCRRRRLTITSIGVATGLAGAFTSPGSCRRSCSVSTPMIRSRSLQRHSSSSVSPSSPVWCPPFAEVVLLQEPGQSSIERMRRRGWQIARRHPQNRIPLACALANSAHCSTLRVSAMSLIGTVTLAVFAVSLRQKSPRQYA